MKTMMLILISIILLKFGWKTIKYLWDNASSIVLLVLALLFFSSDFFLDSYFKDNSFLKNNGYSTGSEGVKQFLKDEYNDRDEYIECFKRAGEKLKSKIKDRIEHSPVALNLVDIWGYQLDSLGNVVSDRPLNDSEIRELLNEYNEKNGTTYKYKEF